MIYFNDEVAIGGSWLHDNVIVYDVVLVPCRHSVGVLQFRLAANLIDESWVVGEAISQVLFQVKSRRLKK